MLQESILNHLISAIIERLIIVSRKKAIVYRGSTITGAYDSVYENAIDDI